MNPDDRPDLRTTPESKLLLKPETEKIIGFAFEVLNEVGHGLNEKAYENSLVVLFRAHNITFHQQRRFTVGLILNFKYARLQWERIVL